MSAPMLSHLASAAGAVTAIAINALWEDALLVVCVWLLLRAWPGLNAATRYLVWSATLIATVVVPVATTLPFLVPSSPPTAVRDTAVRAPMPMVTHALTAAPAAAAANAATHSSLAARSPVKATPERSGPAPLQLPERFRMTLPLPLAAGVLATWILLALVSLVRLGIGLARLEGLKRDALPLPVEYRDAMARWTSVNKGSREVRLCVSDEIDVPVAVGLFDSMILIPRALLERLSQTEVDQISLHELAHLRRADDWSNGFQRLMLALFAWNPGVLFVARQLDLEREVACDDWVLALTGLVRPYALCLTKMAETSSWPYRPMPAPGVFATRRHISLRIERLLGAGRNAATNLSLGPAAAAIAIVAALAFAMQLVAPSVAASVETPAPAQLPRTIKTVEVLSQHRTATTPSQPVTQRQTAQTVERKRTVVALEQKTVAAASPSAVSTAPASAAPTTSPHAHTLPAVVHVPATHVHVPARNVSVPAIDVDVPAMTIAIPHAAQLQSEQMKLRMLQGMHAGSAALAAGAAARSVARATANFPAFHAIAQSSSAKNCSGCDMSGVDWSGRDMRNVSYTGVDLSKAKLQGTNFGGGVFNGVDFSGATLRNASFRGAHLVGCDFSHADLSGVDFTGATIQGCQFTGAQLPSAQLRAVLDTCSGCDFTRANLSGLDLSNVRANGIDFSHANLSNVNFSGARFTGTDFSGAELRGANLTGTELNGCDLSGVDLSHVDLSRAKLIGTDLSQGRPHP